MVDVDSAEIIALILDEEMDIGSRDDALYRMLTESLRPRLLRRFRPYEKRAPFAQAEEINALRYSYVTDSPDMLLHDVDCIFQYGGSRLYEHNFFVTLPFNTEII